MAYQSYCSEPIALVGSACRFAGTITSPSHLFDLTLDLPDLSSDIPSNRFRGPAFSHKNAEHRGTTDAAKGYFLHQDHRKFDASFFGITPKEAEAIDPQQRLLLEVVFEALESAGLTMDQVAGKNVGVFAGAMTGDYDILSARDEINISQYTATGVARSNIANRVSYVYDFRGPSIVIDTACSSSLVALHQAIQSLRSGESPMACVAGVNMLLTPEQFITESNLHMLSPSGHCWMWDQKADGYARGEGLAAIFIKPLSQALADGNHIQAIIRETGVNSDGKTQGITRPSSKAQTTLIRETYTKSGLNPDISSHQPQYFEAHGTGTPVGDPLEAQAISEAFFGQGRDTTQATSAVAAKKMLVGSIKTLIGHTEGAAGLAGVLKVVQSLENGSVIRNFSLGAVNPRILPFCNNLCVVIDPTNWPEPAPGHPCRGSVNSFGFGGTNAHCIIEKYEPAIHNPVARQFDQKLPEQIPQPLGLLEAPAQSEMLQVALPLVVSGASSESLHANLVKYNKLLKSDGHKQSAILAWQLYNHQTTHAFRKVVMVDWKDLVCTQTAMIEVQQPASASQSSIGEPKDMIRATQLHSASRPKILGIFAGQGAQYAAMSKGLFRLSSVYRKTIKALDKVLQACPHPPSWTIQQELMKDRATSSINTAEISQATCCALQIGLVDFLRSIGITFECVVGHSSGEIAAAYAIGGITKNDAILIAYYRGKYARLAVGNGGVKGGMAACGMSKAQAAELCERPEFQGRICVAASNSPTLVTLSGDLDVLQNAIEILQKEGVFVRQLKVDKAYHSFHMVHVVEAYSKALKSCNIRSRLARNDSQCVSTVSGETMDAENEFSVEHWCNNILQPVLFQEAVTAATATWGPFDCVIEVGPHPVLKSPVKDIFKAMKQDTMLHTGILDRTKEDRFAIAEFIGFMWAHFGPSSVDMRQYILDSPHPEIAHSRFPVGKLPTYSWDHSQIHWRESRVSTQFHFRTHAPHELLGVRTRDDDRYNMRWRNILKTEDLPWLVGHKFQGQALLPASAYCAMAFDAADVLLQSQIKRAAVIELSDLEILSGIIVEPGSMGVEILFNLAVPAVVSSGGSEDGFITAEFTLTSVPLKPHGITGDAMTKNFQGKVRIIFMAARDPMPRRPSGPRAETLPVDIDAFYKMMDGTGLNYTGPFRGLKSLDRRLNYAAGTLNTYHPSDTTQLSVSPALLDSCFQATFATFSSPGDKALWTSFLPTNIDKVRLYKPDRPAKEQAVDKNAETTVEAYLTSFKPYTQATTASITADLSMYNSNNEIWIEIEGLKVTSFAPTKPEDDHLMYLHTIMDLDPEEEMVTASPMDGTLGLEVIESCERVAQHFKNKGHFQALDSPPQSPKIPSVVLRNSQRYGVDAARTEDTTDEITQFMQSSCISRSLEFIRETYQAAPELLPEALNMAIQGAQFSLHFQKHLSRVIQQIAHRYPRMNVLSLTDSRLGVTEAIIDGLQGSFRHLTLGQGVEAHLASRLPGPNSGRMSVGKLDLNDAKELEMPAIGPYDMVIMSTTIFMRLQGPDWSPVAALRRLRRITRNGGFLLLIDASPLRSALKAEVPATPPNWQDWLEDSDFVERSRCAYQHFPLGWSLHIRQARSERKDTIQSPVSWRPEQVLAQDLLIVGGSTDHGSSLAAELERVFGEHCRSLSRANTLENISLRQATECTAIILLTDQEKPIATNLIDDQLTVLKRIMRSGMVILWVTTNATEDAERAAGLGLTRTLKAEIPDLHLQVLDVMNSAVIPSLICETFYRLLHSRQSSDRNTEDAILWSTEGEIHMLEGKRLIPRVMPYRPGNERYNAYRRPVTKALNSGREAVLLHGLPNGDGSSRDGESVVRLISIPQDPGPIAKTVRIRADYSSSWAIKVGESLSSGSMYVCVGRNMETGNTTVGLSTYQASIVRVPEAYTRDMTCHGFDTKLLVDILAKTLFINELLVATPTRNLVLVNADPSVVRLLRRIESVDSASPHFWTTDHQMADKYHYMTYIHPWISIRDLKRALPEDYTVRAFIPKASQLWKNLVSVCPELDLGYGSPVTNDSSAHLMEPHGMEFCAATTSTWAWATRQTVDEMLNSDTCDKTAPSLVMPEMLASKQPTESLPPFCLVNWKDNRALSIPVTPQARGKSMHADRTYLLVGMTRDFGQSLCRLFVEQGARYIIVASRKPDPKAAWIAELNRNGANIMAKTLDVTDLESVKRLKAQIDGNLKIPRLGGIVNGAMVLEDGVFANMDIASWKRVTGPKVEGSHNLDAVFGDEHLEFFIMTSSFGAIGGHAGQSAYTAANMYMNGLAQSRYARGKAGSVLNIGVIYGIGVLARDNRQSVYDALERDGYPPLSERDIHHMFLEAIEAGRPGRVPRAAALVDLCTGLSRFSENDPNPPHWHRDERFGHLVRYDADATPVDVGEAKVSLRDRIAAADAEQDIAAVLESGLCGRMEVILQRPSGSVRGDNSVAELGVDSLAAVEIRNWFYKVVEENVAVMKILGAASIQALCKEVAKQMVKARKGALHTAGTGAK